MPAKRHGMRHTRVYESWAGMRKRCLNPNAADFAYYGGRGIGITPRWDMFEAFLADMGEPGPGLTLDRIDVDSDYGPDNCRWATRKVQSRNRRGRVLFTHRGETHCLTEWAELVGLHRGCVQSRVRMGWSIAQALGLEYRKPRWPEKKLHEIGLAPQPAKKAPAAKKATS